VTTPRPASHAELLTVVVPVRDDADVVAGALGSLLAQRGGPPTVVVVDDGSTDGSAAAARQAAPEATVLVSGGRGPSVARNVGAHAAATPLLAFLDADDWWPEDRIVNDLTRLDADPELPAIVGRSRFVPDEPALLEGFHFDEGTLDADLWHLGALTVRRSTWTAVGPLDERLDRFEDQDWFLRARDAGLAVVETEDLALFHRRRWDSMTGGVHVTPRERLAFLRHTAARQRARQAGRQTAAHPEEGTS
jgi:glycosyltransferase involved in cell wall biosynthesis